jgi:hypothetical protein
MGYVAFTIKQTLRQTGAGVDPEKGQSENWDRTDSRMARSPIEVFAETITPSGGRRRWL